MPMLELSDEQVVQLFTQLSPERKREVLLVLASEADLRRDERFAQAQTQLRRLSRERGLNWDAMTEDERELFVDDLLHDKEL